MIARGRRNAADAGVALSLIRGIGEALPFRDRSFDRVVCQASIDHFAHPAEGLREMARVVGSEGRVIIGFVNYDGLSCRGSRVLYRLGRALGLVRAGTRLFWDSPIDGEHTFEARLSALKTLAGASLRLEAVYGVSLLWAFPGWRFVFRLIPGKSRFAVRVRDGIARGMDGIGRAWPSLSDFLVTTWQPTGSPRLS
jgi:SAM-dependent methyltransferase